MIALQPFHLNSSRVVETRLPHGLADDLGLYRLFYKDAYHAEVSEGDLVREMLQAFIEGDEAFRQFKRQAKSRVRPKRSRQAKVAPNSSQKNDVQGDDIQQPARP